MTVVVVLIVFMFAGCDTTVGPQGVRGDTGATGEQGETGEQGPAGEALYLVDADGVRIASGGSYYLGEVVQEGPSVVTELFLENKTGSTVTIVSIAAELEYVIRPNGQIVKFGAVTEIAAVLPAVLEIAPDTRSGAITFTLAYEDWVVVFGAPEWSEARKRYRITLTDGEGDIFSDIEVYGLLRKVS